LSLQYGSFPTRTVWVSQHTHTELVETERDGHAQGETERERHQKPTLVGPAFDQGPSDITTFYEAIELVRKIVESIRVCRSFGANWDVGKGMLLGGFKVQV